MQKVKPTFTNLAWICLLTCGLLLAPSCVTPKKTAYNTLSLIGMTVDKAMMAAADAKVAGKISDADWARIAAVHDKFRASYKTACDLAATSVDTTPFVSDELVRLQADLLQLINTFLQ